MDFKKWSCRMELKAKCFRKKNRNAQFRKNLRKQQNRRKWRSGKIKESHFLFRFLLLGKRIITYLHRIKYFQKLINGGCDQRRNYFEANWQVRSGHFEFKLIRPILIDSERSPGFRRGIEKMIPFLGGQWCNPKSI